MNLKPGYGTPPSHFNPSLKTYRKRVFLNINTSTLGKIRGLTINKLNCYDTWRGNSIIPFQSFVKKKKKKKNTAKESYLIYTLIFWKVGD